MKKINLNIYPLEINKIKALEKAFNELLDILAQKGIIELEEDIENGLSENELGE